jgi:hypothetical protein
MKNIITLVIFFLTLSLTFIGCGNGTTSTGTTSNPTVNNNDSALNGTWVYEDGFEIQFNDGNFIISPNRPPEISPFAKIKGTYTTSGRQITMKITHLYIDNKFYSKDDLRVLIKEENPALSNEVIDANLEEWFSTVTHSYSISGNKLTFDGDIFIKK